MLTPATFALGLALILGTASAAPLSGHQQWIETNGLGSVISGDTQLANSSKYHGLLVGIDRDGGRVTLVNTIEAWIEDTQGRRTYLSANHYPNGATYPDGAKHLRSFTSQPWPTWEFALPDGSRVKREVVFLHGTQRVVVSYSLAGSGQYRLFLRPLLSGRSYFGVRRDYSEANLTPIRITSQSVDFRPEWTLPPFRILHQGSWRSELFIYYNQTYALTAKRYEDAIEHLWSPGEISFELKQETPARIVLESLPFFSAHRRPRTFEDPALLLAKELERRDRINNAIVTDDPRLRLLAASSEHYLFTRPDGKASVLAGFPWFLDWGRDTFISTEGLLLQKGRVEEAHRILANFASYERDGLLPNVFPTLGSEPAYNTVDAPLWFVHLAGKSLDYGNSLANVARDLWPAINGIIDSYSRGTYYGIQADPMDGLVRQGEAGLQLTWMDVKIGDTVVTPRWGKNIEINALWHRALSVAIDLGERLGEDPERLIRWRRTLALVEQNFDRRFFDPASGMLRDVVDSSDPTDFARIRPNSLFALALSPRLLPPSHAEAALSLVERELLTPYGLRTLSPSDSKFTPRYSGNWRERDLAYHQGTVWPFLLGAYAEAVENTRGKAALEKVWEGIQPLLDHAVTDATGHISEVFDATAPHFPGGCWAQAWSDAEVLRLAVKAGKLSFRVSH